MNKPKPQRRWTIKLVETELMRAFNNGYELSGNDGTYYLTMMDPSQCFEGSSIEDCLVAYLGFRAREVLADQAVRDRKLKPKRRRGNDPVIQSR